MIEISWEHLRSLLIWNLTTESVHELLKHKWSHISELRLCIFQPTYRMFKKLKN